MLQLQNLHMENVHVLPDRDLCLHGVQPAHWMTKGELLDCTSDQSLCTPCNSQTCGVDCMHMPRCQLRDGAGYTSSMSFLLHLHLTAACNNRMPLRSPCQVHAQIKCRFERPHCDCTGQQRWRTQMCSQEKGLRQKHHLHT